MKVGSCITLREAQYSYGIDTHPLKLEYRLIQHKRGRRQRLGLRDPQLGMLHVQLGALAVRQRLLGVTLAATSVLLVNSTAVDQPVRLCAVYAEGVRLHKGTPNVTTGKHVVSGSARICHEGRFRHQHMWGNNSPNALHIAYTPKHNADQYNGHQTNVDTYIGDDSMLDSPRSLQGLLPFTSSSPDHLRRNIPLVAYGVHNEEGGSPLCQLVG